MKTLFVLSTLIGVVLSTASINDCDSHQCDSDFERNNGPIPFKSKHNVSKVANLTSSIKNIQYVPAGGSENGNMLMDTTEEAALLRKLSKKLTSISATPFDPSASSTTSPKCKLHSQMFFDGLQNFDLWAVRMHDSTAKISSGILNGNVNYFGDFDQCLNIQGPLDNLKGKYCLTGIDTEKYAQTATLVQFDAFA